MLTALLWVTSVLAPAERATLRVDPLSPQTLGVIDQSRRLLRQFREPTPQVLWVRGTDLRDPAGDALRLRMRHLSPADARRVVATLQRLGNASPLLLRRSDGLARVFRSAGVALPAPAAGDEQILAHAGLALAALKQRPPVLHWRGRHWAPGGRGEFSDLSVGQQVRDTPAPPATYGTPALRWGGPGTPHSVEVRVGSERAQLLGRVAQLVLGAPHIAVGIGAHGRDEAATRLQRRLCAAAAGPWRSEYLRYLLTPVADRGGEADVAMLEALDSTPVEACPATEDHPVLAIDGRNATLAEFDRLVRTGRAPGQRSRVRKLPL